MKSDNQRVKGADLLQIRGLKIEGNSDGIWNPIVKGVDLSLKRGEVLGLIGESGAGKSTIGLAAMGFARPGCRITDGTIMFDGIDLRAASEAEKRRWLQAMLAERMSAEQWQAEQLRYAERQLMARELHDVVGHHLTALHGHGGGAHGQLVGIVLHFARCFAVRAVFAALAETQHRMEPSWLAPVAHQQVHARSREVVGKGSADALRGSRHKGERAVFLFQRHGHKVNYWKRPMIRMDQPQIFD